MWEKYKETFDGVHASQRLKTEVLNMKREENVTRRRRVPAAVLVAAVLVVALAGTALAYLSRVTVTPYGDGYRVQAETGNTPLTSLSEAVLDQAAVSDDSMGLLSFDSWDEAEAYLGLEIANNDRLDRMKKGVHGMALNEKDTSTVAPSLIWLYYRNGLPDMIGLIASYKEGNFSITTESVLMIEDPESGEDREYRYDNPIAEQFSAETYITPSNIEATIISYQTRIPGRMKYKAEFVLNRAFFSVEITVKRGESGEEALALLKEILDAYE